MKYSILYKGIVKAADHCLTLAARALPAWKQSATAELLPPMLHVPVRLPVNHAQLPQPFAGHFIDIKHIPLRKFFLLKNVWVSGSAVVIRNFRIFLPSLTWLADLDLHRRGKLLIKQWLPGYKKIPAGKTAALVYDHWSCHNYYHWMIEALPRLLMVQMKYPDSLLLVPDPCPGYISRTLDLMEANRRFPLHKDTGRLVKVPSLVLPELVYYYQAHELELITRDEPQAPKKTDLPPPRPEEPASSQQEELIVEVRRKLLDGFNPQRARPFRKVYVSRARQKNRRLLNEAEILPLLEKEGFELVYFEDMTLDEQINLMQETSVLMGVHGANMVNIMFLNPGCRVIELMNQYHFNEAYYILSSSFSLPYYSVPCSMADPTLLAGGDKISMNNAHLLVDVHKLEQALTKALADLAKAVRTA